MKFHFDNANHFVSSTVSFRHQLRALILAIFFLVAACSGGSSVVDNPGNVDDGRLSAVLETARAGHGVPAMAAVGSRVVNQPESVTVNDQWHLGSISKSITSTLTAVLIEQGFLDWDTTIADVLLVAVPDMRAEYRDVRIDQLMAHTAGLPVDVTQSPAFIAGDLNDTSMIPMMDKRLMWSADMLRMAPEAAIGSHLYSNASYIVLGAILEQLTGELWEDLMQRELFAPLGMINSGFGPPGSPGMRTQPWGHRGVGGGWQAFDPGDFDADNTLTIGPAGTVHSTLDDFAAYMSAHLAGARGEDGLIRAANFARLHTPQPGTIYSGGWVVEPAAWAGTPVIWHNGSNGRWFAHTVIARDKNAAFLVATNSNSRAAVEDMVGVMITRFESQ
jgi:CubicO group peptidase (beta-lactamase class C family)